MQCIFIRHNSRFDVNIHVKVISSGFKVCNAFVPNCNHDNLVLFELCEINLSSCATVIRVHKKCR